MEKSKSKFRQIKTLTVESNSAKANFGSATSLVLCELFNSLFVCGDSSPWIQSFNLKSFQFKSKSTAPNPRFPQGPLGHRIVPALGHSPEKAHFGIHG